MNEPYPVVLDAPSAARRSASTTAEIRRSKVPLTGAVRSDGCDLYYEELGEGVPIMLIHP